MTHLKKWLSALLALAMLLGCCGSLAETAVEAPVQASPLEGQLTLQDLETAGATAYTHNDRVTFVDGDCAGAPVASMADAAKVVDSAIALLGGDGQTRFEPWRELTDTAGNRYFVFQQMHADTTVLGGAAKVVTDPSGAMLGLVGSVQSDLPEANAAEGITDTDAEALVLEHMAEANQPEAELVEGHTEKVILPVTLVIDVTADEYDESNRFVWSVYTTNPGEGTDKGTDLPYLAHYVTLDGEYLYNLPTIIPGDEAGASGYNAAYVFEFMEPADYTGTVTLSDGTRQEITVTLMRDGRTGMYYLGNLERRIVVADCYEFLYNNGHVVLEASADNTGWDETCLLSLYNYCQAWDYYHDIGWTGGDGQQTPMIILKDFCNGNHDPIDNAAYAGRIYGWQTFLSSSINDFSQCLDVLSHEFTHCVTGSVMTYNAYMNDFGAINEAMSDIQGNICEMMMGATEDDTWLIGENSISPVFRSMSDPQLYGQPAFSWDLHYVSQVKSPTELNDRGGVHTNSSLLNNVAYRLCEKGGMTLEEARAFWFAVDCAMVPGTDYAQLSELMPWVLEHLGMEQYHDALEAAMDATRIRSDAVPEVFDDDRALVTLTLPDDEGFMDGNWQLMILTVDIDTIIDRAKDVMSGEGEYAGALDELLDIVTDSGMLGETDDSPSGDDFAFGLIDTFINFVGGAPEDVAEPEAVSETEPDAEPETEPAEDSAVDSAAMEALIEKAMEWFDKYLADTFFLGNGAAGQDGRTVRMVCRPGMTVPVLYRLEIDSEMELRSMGLGVYSYGKWIDVGGILKPVLELATSEEEIDLNSMDLSAFEALMGPNKDSDEVPSTLSIALDLIANWDEILKKVFTRVKGGEITEIPGEGLEGMTVYDHDFIVDVFGTANLLDLPETMQTDAQES